MLPHIRRALEENNEMHESLIEMIDDGESPSESLKDAELRTNLGILPKKVGNYSVQYQNDL